MVVWHIRYVYLARVTVSMSQRERTVCVGSSNPARSPRVRPRSITDDICLKWIRKVRILIPHRTRSDGLHLATMSNFQAFLTAAIFVVFLSLFPSLIAPVDAKFSLSGLSSNIFSDTGSLSNLHLLQRQSTFGRSHIAGHSNDDGPVSQCPDVI